MTSNPLPTLPPQRISVECLVEKYCLPGETSADDVRRRVATAIAAVEADPEYWQPRFVAAQQRGLVMGGRINASAGSGRDTTWINCFVQPIADAISHSDDEGNPGMTMVFGACPSQMNGHCVSRLELMQHLEQPVSIARVVGRARARRGLA